MAIQLQDGDKCSLCDLPATQIACGREGGHPEVAVYCDAHANQVAEEGYPEYTTECPNCKCWFGVN